MVLLTFNPNQYLLTVGGLAGAGMSALGDQLASTDNAAGQAVGKLMQNKKAQKGLLKGFKKIFSFAKDAVEENE